MSMTWVFAIFAAISASLGAAMPHLVHRLGYRMALVYMAFAAVAALIGLVRRTR
jgi:hypothetical protein